MLRGKPRGFQFEGSPYCTGRPGRGYGWLRLRFRHSRAAPGGRESIAVLQMVWKRRYPSIIMPYFHYNRGESTGAGQSAPIGVAKISPHPADTLRRRLYKLSPQLDRRVGADEVAARSAHNGGWSSPSYSQSCHSVTPTRHAAAARRILLCCCRPARRALRHEATVQGSHEGSGRPPPPPRTT